MPSLNRPFRCEVITPEGRAFGGELTSATFPAPDGLVGVLGGRGPLVMLLGSGQLTVRELSGEEASYFVAGGFARFMDNALTLMAEECDPVPEIDAEDAWTRIEAAQDLPQETETQARARDEALQRARNRFRLAQLYRQEMEEG